MESLCWKCSPEGGPLLICLKMISIFITLLRWHYQKDSFRLLTQCFLPREPEKMRAITTAIVETEEDDDGSEVEPTEEANNAEYLRQMDVDMQT